MADHRSPVDRNDRTAFFLEDDFFSGNAHVVMAALDRDPGDQAFLLGADQAEAESLPWSEVQVFLDGQESQERAEAVMAPPGGFPAQRMEVFRG